MTYLGYDVHSHKNKIVVTTSILFLGTRASNNALADILIEANTTGRFWIGASDLEEVGHFKWFYSGKTIPQIHWDNKGKPKDEEEAIKLDMVCTKSFYI